MLGGGIILRLIQNNINDFGHMKMHVHESEDSIKKVDLDALGSKLLMFLSVVDTVLFSLSIFGNT